ncbi:hypothetical protein AX16_001017 [Volvariella volvacea WC 439]|nr:hypothetical protein AX16_001017 [Volvariella volvacea WC 439]
MPKTLSKVIYKPSTQSTEEYTVIIDPAEYKKWRNGGKSGARSSSIQATNSTADTSIPLAQVVDSFNVYHSTQGSQGILGKPSKQQLDTTFGTSVDVDVIKFILENGKEQSGEAIASTTFNLNPARGSGTGEKGRGQAY